MDSCWSSIRVFTTRRRTERKRKKPKTLYQQKQITLTHVKATKTGIKQYRSMVFITMIGTKAFGKKKFQAMSW